MLYIRMTQAELKVAAGTETSRNSLSGVGILARLIYAALGRG
jgi:hypothetical protein